MNGGWPCRQPGNIQAAWLAMFLAVAPGPGNLLRAADFVSSAPPSTNAILAPLEYQEGDDSVNNLDISITPQSVSFKKEPPGTSNRAIRGILKFDAANYIPFLWQRDQGKLFLDLNCNGDLTDDPAGVFSARKQASLHYQTFAHVHLELGSPSASFPVLMDLTFWDYGSQPVCYAGVRSFWAGKVRLGEHDWQAGLILNDFKQPADASVRLLLRPWDNHDQAINPFDGSLNVVPYSQKLFLDGHAYQLEVVASPQNGEIKPGLRLTEQTVALGELKITGKFIQRLVLPGTPCLVVLDKPGETVEIPVGNYEQPSILLKQGDMAAFYEPSQPWQGRRQIVVNNHGPAILTVGGPLTNSVTATRLGQDLNLSYRLIGEGGATYQLINQDRTKPPAFAVYKGKNKIASGKFQYG